MRILYGVQGTGNGHITRARLLCSALKQQGIQVDVLMSGREGEMPDVPEFGRYRKVKGVSFHHKGGRVNKWATFHDLSLRQFAQDVKALDLSSYDLLINDFEPVSAWAAKQRGVDSLSISHQAAFLHDIPTKEMGFWNRRLVRNFAPCKYNLGVHWADFKQTIVPPLVETLENISNNGKVLVYLPFESLHQILPLLKRFTGHQFVCFHPEIKHPVSDGNIQLQPISRNEFLDNLRACAGVFCNAGFELPSEAMAAGKKLLVKPLFGQFEQVTNAYTLQSLGLAHVAESLEPYQLDSWLQMDQAEPVYYPNVAELLATYIKNDQWQNLEAMAKDMWQQVSYPAASQLLMANIMSDRAPSAESLTKVKVSG
ncbi:MJ1255/VC2487 family glycosyltransferase [Agarivorans sp. 1_MG-2023]|uniref:MJ1255/VC2487 family glycosyltransferase n=1 Tax=Agarivorans sp. 1_MG-2023 TaxID=3062634 RepID=UPI0026E20D40|nr:MJ1255/VC2487 family glycosyltransferase [Agarivorans sp. 1_MG-2023]MDO6764630.1 glycosyltransferase family protein [Agarivorans sp. 1_MG-2023]